MRPGGACPDRFPLPRLSRYRYYAASLPRLCLGFRRPLQILRIFLGRQPFPTEIETRSGLRFIISSALDAWVIKETTLDYGYLPPWVRPGRAWTVVDIGGALGDFTVLAARLCPEGAVHAAAVTAEGGHRMLTNAGGAQRSGVAEPH